MENSLSECMESNYRETNMKQILILSGKGGTGKTTVASALFDLSIKNKQSDEIIAVDCDVDASNFPYVFPYEIIEENEFFGMKKASLIPDKCSSCKSCLNSCRYNAISWDEKKEIPIINQRLCEGCGVCEYTCPNQAIHSIQTQAGTIYQVQTSTDQDYTYFFANLLPGEDISGKLVTAVREKAITYAQEHGSELVILDGSPGIGCPVIASITGVDKVIIVTEPSKSALNDLIRLIQLVKHFKIPINLVINKCDIFLPVVDEIQELCKLNDIEIISMIPYDEKVIEALNNNQSIITFDFENVVSKEIQKIYEKVMN